VPASCCPSRRRPRRPSSTRRQPSRWRLRGQARDACVDKRSATGCVGTSAQDRVGRAGAARTAGASIPVGAASRPSSRPLPRRPAGREATAMMKTIPPRDFATPGALASKVRNLRTTLGRGGECKCAIPRLVLRTRVKPLTTMSFIVGLHFAAGSLGAPGFGDGGRWSRHRAVLRVAARAPARASDDRHRDHAYGEKRATHVMTARATA
jgi:hypothetical protein